MQKGPCSRIWLLYLQGRLSPAQVLALCKLANENRERTLNHDHPPSAA
ncbi:hypothetical protein [Leptothoe sp. PORK10 BA2]|nr:hypothetical protein [Leptothoe sp. PORK10 BA2]MEA5463171.1 hypothetical protein [Leptothoe sp. PORK10 BA2]